MRETASFASTRTTWAARPAATLFCFVAAFSALSSSTGCLLGATNPFDPEASDELQVPALLTGSITYEEGGSGTVLVQAIGSGGASDVVGQELSVDAGGRRFALSVPARTRLVRAEPIACGYLPASVEVFDLLPGEERDIGELRLGRRPPAYTLRGSVVRADGVSPGGIGVTVRPASDDGGCAPETIRTTTAADGSWVVTALSAGTYVASTKAEGVTVAVSSPVSLCEELDVTAPPITLEALADLVTLEAAEDGLPPGVTRAPTVNVLLDVVRAAWADEMRISGDPTFATGGTGWVPVASQRLFPDPTRPAEVFPDDTEVELYVELRSACADSPLYRAGIVFDPQGPQITEVKLKNIEAEGLEGAGLVVVDDEAAVPLGVDGFDESGLVATVVVTPEDPTANAPPTQVFTLDLSGLFALRELVQIPLDEGRYDVDIFLSDLVGNPAPALPGPVHFSLIRDREAPTTPLPSVTAFETGADVAYIWLDDRECERVLSDGTVETYRAPVCEQNPSAAGPYEVRGGPALIDFTPFQQPPFVVPLVQDGDTQIEIRAVDDAGNASPSLGQVTVSQRRTRTLFTAPTSRRLAKAGGRQRLAATSGTAVFQVATRPGVTSASPYNVLVAQAAHLDDVGLLRAESVDPNAIRKISMDADSADYDDFASPFTRWVSALAAGDGMVTWHEYAYEGALSRSMQIAVAPGPDGRFDLYGPSALFTGVDDEGDPAPHPYAFGPESFDNVLCQAFGRQMCRRSDGWRAADQELVGPAFFDGRRTVVGGAGSRPLLDLPTTAVDEVTFTGPRFVGARLIAVTDDRPYLDHFTLQGDLPAGVRFAVGPYELAANGSEFTPDGTYNWDGDYAYPVIEAAGGGREEIVTGDYYGFRAELVVGLFIDDGVSITLPLAEVPPLAPPPDGGVVDGGTDEEPPPPERSYIAGGLVNLDGLVPNAFDRPPNVSFADLDDATDATRTPILSALVADYDLVGAGSFNGLTVVDMGSDRQLAPQPAVGGTPSDIGPSDSVTTGGIRDTAHVTVRGTEAGTEVLTVPDEGLCSLLIDVKEPVILDDAAIRGAGILDDLILRAYKKDAGSTFGGYQRQLPFVGSTHPDFAQAYFRPPPESGVTSCEDVVLDVKLAEDLSGAIGTTELSTVVESGLARAQNLIPGIATGLQPVTGTPFSVTPGDALLVKMSHITGDPDLYVRFGPDPPTYADFDCRPYVSVDEFCYRTVPAGVTEMHVWVDGYFANSEYDVEIVNMESLPSIPFPPGEDDIYVELDLDAPGGSARGVLNYDAPAGGQFLVNDECGYAPNPAFFCADYPLGAFTSIETGVFQLLPADWSMEIRLFRDNSYALLADYEVVPGDVVRVAGSSTARLLMGFDPDNALDYECSDYPSGGQVDCDVTIPSGVDRIYVFVAEDETPGNFDVTATIESVGCDVVQSSQISGLPSATAELEPGLWLFTLSGGATTWPALAPSVRVGTASAAASGPVSIIGGVTAPTLVLGPDYEDDVMVVDAFSSQAACGLDLSFALRPAITAVSVGETLAVAAEETVANADAVASRIAALPLVDGQLGAARIVYESDDGSERVFAVAAVGDRSLALTASATGGGPVLREHIVDPADPASVIACAPVSLDAALGTMVVSAASFQGRRLVVAGQAGGLPTVRLVGLPPSAEGDGCAVPAVLDGYTAPGITRASVVAGADLFSWHEPPGTGGILLHRDLRELSTMHPGGARVATSVAPSSSGIFVGLNDQAGPLATELLRFQPATGSASRLSSSHVRYALTPVGNTLLAHLRLPLQGGDGVPLSPTPDLVLRPTDATDDTTDVVVASAQTILVGLPSFDPLDRFQWVRQPRLASGGRTLGVVGSVSGQPSMMVFDVGTDPAAWGQMVPVVPPESIGGTVVSLSATNDAVVAVRDDLEAVVVHRDPAGDWTASGDFDVLTLRILGAGAGSIYAARAPGPQFTLKPTLYADVYRIDPERVGELQGTDIPADADLVGRLPAESYTHAFTAIVVDADGGVLLYDEDASPPALWRLSGDGAVAQTIDGPHRPLLGDDPLLGAAARPRRGDDGLWMMRTENGQSRLTRLSGYRP